jgi:hypothetical protein
MGINVEHYLLANKVGIEKLQLRTKDEIDVFYRWAITFLNISPEEWLVRITLRKRQDQRYLKVRQKLLTFIEFILNENDPQDLKSLHPKIPAVAQAVIAFIEESAGHDESEQT